MMNEIIREEEGNIQSLSPPTYSTHVPIIPMESTVPLNQYNTNNLNQNQNQPQVYHVPMANFYQPIISYSDLRQHYLKENFPSCFVIFHSLFMMFISLALIGGQVVLTYKDDYLAEYGAGFLAGGFLLLTSLITIITVSYRSFCLVVTSAFMHLVSMLASFGGAIVISVLAIIKSNCLDNLNKCESDLVFITNLAMISVGIISMIACLVYFIGIQCGVLNKAAKTSNHIRSSLINPNFNINN